MKQYDHKGVSLKWSTKWEEEKIYSPDLKNAKKPFYNLMMFPYPSAEGLHVGNMYAFTGTDIFGRFKRMMGFDVFEPIGLDGFGIHSENYAIKVGRHPKEHARISQEHFYRQLGSIGNGFSWERRLETYNPEYYKWTQWLFTELFKAGLAYKKEALVNWCPSCKTVLADEQVEGGVCERCKSRVERREMSSWFFKITDYSERLLSNIEKIDWPEKIKTAQKNWIGKKEGIRVSFALKNIPGQEDGKHKVEVFTTRLDTIDGVSFIVIAPELAKKWMDLGWQAQEETKAYISASLLKSEQERQTGATDKSGVDTSLVAINPYNQKEIPVWVADYVLMGVGTGAVMGVPSHDERDLEFAKKFSLPIPKTKLVSKEKVFQKLSREKVAEKMVTHHLRDWLISRQRYWGAPIPMVFCKKCDQWQPLDVASLPVLLPDISDFKPKGDGSSPLSNAPDSWKKTKCPNCKGEAQRELDVCDTFLDSSWYFLGYLHMQDGKWDKGATPFDPQKLLQWLPVDAYIGGAEHAVLHLLYARFIWMVLKDRGHLKDISSDEPFPFLFSHGLIIKDGAKMSKSRGNVVIPDKYIEKFGADTFRLYLMFLGPYDSGGDFRDSGIEGMYRFLMRVWRLFEAYKKDKKVSEEVEMVVNKTTKKVTEDIQNFRYNTAISAIMELTSTLRDNPHGKKELKILAQLLAPFAPFLTEEVWEMLGEKFSIHKTIWPTYDKKKTESSKVTIIVQVNGKLKGTIEVSKEEAKDKEKITRSALSLPKVKEVTKGKEVKNTIFVQGRIINFVI